MKRQSFPSLLLRAQLLSALIRSSLPPQGRARPERPRGCAPVVWRLAGEARSLPPGAARAEEMLGRRGRWRSSKSNQ
eukprot:1619989-Alexandrium_andersonii.AAC.1